MDLWELHLIYAPVSGPCRSMHAPGEVKSWMGTRATTVPPATGPLCRHPAAAEVGLGLLWCVWVSFLCFLSPVQGILVFLLCPFLVVFSKGHPLGHEPESAVVPCLGLTLRLGGEKGF